MKKFEFTHSPDPEQDQFEQLKQLAKMQCTNAEIAAFFHVSLDTLKRRLKDQEGVREAIEEGREGGKMSLRRAQYKAAAIKGNITMLIWLGKQYLGQSDKADVTTGGLPFEFSFTVDENNPDDESQAEG